MPENIEVFFPIGVAVAGVVGADYLVLEDLLCSFIEAVCKPVVNLAGHEEIRSTPHCGSEGDHPSPVGTEGHN